MVLLFQIGFCNMQTIENSTAVVTVGIRVHVDYQKKGVAGQLLSTALTITRSRVPRLTTQQWHVLTSDYYDRKLADPGWTGRILRKYVSKRVLQLCRKQSEGDFSAHKNRALKYKINLGNYRSKIWRAYNIFRSKDPVAGLFILSK